MSKTIMIMSGEPSGDRLGGFLANAIRQIAPETQLVGVGSQHMHAAGVEIILNSDPLAVVGLFEILRHLATLRAAMKCLENYFKNSPPDLLILIDYPGFNLRLAEKAKQYGIKVMYYVSPQIWAWHYSRIKKIRKNVDLMAVLFPFEKKLYDKENVPAKYVGHPLLANLKAELSHETALAKFQLNPSHPIIGLVPGSRRQELKRMLPHMLAAAQYIRTTIPNAQFVLPLAANLPDSLLKKYDLSGITVIKNNTYNALQCCDAAIVTSGTVTLEIALLQIPLVIAYRFSPVTYHLCKYFVKVKQFGLCNIVAETCIAPELLQNQVNAKSLANAILKILQDDQHRNHIRQLLLDLKNKLDNENAAEKAAKAVVSMI